MDDDGVGRSVAHPTTSPVPDRRASQQPKTANRKVADRLGDLLRVSVIPSPPESSNVVASRSRPASFDSGLLALTHRPTWP
jgi:hypothetical protein